jgi:protein TonB
VKSIFDNLLLTGAILISLVVHGIFLLIHFVAPSPVRTQATDPGLEVILVNAKHDKKPLNAQALAQANLDGGGANDTGRAKSPLPDMGKIENGEAVMVAKRKIEQLEENQKRLMDQMRLKTPLSSQRQNDQLNPDENKLLTAGRDQQESSRALARMAAEISQTIEDQNKRPRKTFITPSTQAVGYAVYYKALQKRIEDMGTMNFPQKDGRKLYGELIIYIPIFQDGSIFEKEGGPKIEKTSGNSALDSAALRIVRRAAPFGKFPANMRSKDKDDIWVVITRFKFTRDELLETELGEGAK